MKNIERRSGAVAEKRERRGRDEANSKIPDGAIIGFTHVCLLFFVFSFVEFFSGTIFAGSQAGRPLVTLHGHAMGTTWTLKFSSLPANISSEEISETADAIFIQIEKSVSSYREDSEVMRFNRSRRPDWFSVSKTTASIAGEALRVAKLSGGAFDPTVDPLVRLWGFGAARQGGHRVPAEKEIEAALARIGWEKLEVRLDPPALKKTQSDVEIDLSALTCGYAIDRLAEELDARGAQNYLLELGGALRARGVSTRGRAWRTGVEWPGTEIVNEKNREKLGERKIACAVELADRAISTSGSYKQFFDAEGRRFSHIIDARTGWPVEDKLVSVTVVAKTCLEADAWDTALMAMGAEAAWNLALERGMAVLFIMRDGKNLAQKMTPEFRRWVVQAPAR